MFFWVSAQFPEVVDVYRREGEKLAENWVFIETWSWFSREHSTIRSIFALAKRIGRSSSIPVQQRICKKAIAFTPNTPQRISALEVLLGDLGDKIAGHFQDSW